MTRTIAILSVFVVTATAFNGNLLRAEDGLKLIKAHCAKCHTGQEPDGDFSSHELREAPDERNLDYWISSLERVEADEMPPADQSKLTADEKKQLVDFLRKKITLYEETQSQPLRVPTRRLNNREFENSVRDVLMIEDIGSHHPTSMLLGDTLHDGFDTHGETLGMSEYHLDQYVTAVRKILDGAILTGDRPRSRRVVIDSQDMAIVDTDNRKRQKDPPRCDEGIEIRGQEARLYCPKYQEIPHTGRYRIKVRAMAKDRHVYEQDKTGIYDDDPLVLRMLLGSQVADFDLKDGKIVEYEIDRWLVEGTTIEFAHQTDGLRMKGNGNFKFQRRIAHDHIKANEPERYARILREEVPKSKRRKNQPTHHSHWAAHWQGPRPVIASMSIEGPFYESWPPKRQQALLGEKPNPKKAVEILKPIAERAWRRPPAEEELLPIAELVHNQAKTMGDVPAFKEGIAAILVSPSFLMLNPEASTPELRFATKIGYLFGSSTPDAALLKKVQTGKLKNYKSVLAEVRRRLAKGQADEFLEEFPKAWLQLDRINFMAPDIDKYPLYEKKEIGEDMVNEVLAFFRHNVTENRPVYELLTADYSFVNADLAKVYQIDGVPYDSTLRKYRFKDGRRGGFLGMGAFLTLTADTLNTSPIHRAVYVMENFMGLHPSPPPADVEIVEPDVRSAKTIREVLKAHQSDRTCAACHQSIDPFGYAFENFDPVGAWRDQYADDLTEAPKSKKKKKNRKNKSKKRSKKNRDSKQMAVNAIDASATFPSGSGYRDIVEFRKLMSQSGSRDRFVRCFIVKLLTYANGVEPESVSEVDALVRESAKHDYKIVETIAAVIDSPLFRETK